MKQAIADDAESRAEADSERQSQEALAALVKPGWLMGRWVDSSQGSWTCSTGPYEQYDRGGRYSYETDRGRWQLNGQALTIIVPSASVAFTITDASMENFNMQRADGDERTFRRCSTNEMQQSVDETPDEAPAPEQPQAEPTAEPSPQ